MDTGNLSPEERERYRTIASRWMFETFLPPGDVMTLTAAVRDLHRAYPGRFETGVRTRHPGIWLHNPRISPISIDAGQRLYVHYDRIRKQGSHRFHDRGIEKKANIIGEHMIDGYRDFISAAMRLPIPRTCPLPELFFSDEEIARRPLDGPYWIVFAGSKNDYTNKRLDTAKYQAVVNAMSDIRFVQVGASADYHPRLRGAEDMVGKTSLRDLIVLIRHSSGVLCPITCGLHIAAACGVPCVVVAGGREPPSWEMYPGQAYLHTIGEMDCCEKGGCFRNRADALPGSDCRHLVKGDTIPQAACMHAIGPEHIVSAIRGLADGRDVGAVRIPVPLGRFTHIQQLSRPAVPAPVYARRESISPGKSRIESRPPEMTRWNTNRP